MYLPRTPHLQVVAAELDAFCCGTGTLTDHVEDAIYFAQFYDEGQKLPSLDVILSFNGRPIHIDRNSDLGATCKKYLATPHDDKSRIESVRLSPIRHWLRWFRKPGRSNGMLVCTSLRVMLIGGVLTDIHRREANALADYLGDQWSSLSKAALPTQVTVINTEGDVLFRPTPVSVF